MLHAFTCILHVERGAEMMKRFLLVPKCSLEQSSLVSISACDVTHSLIDQVVAEDCTRRAEAVRVQHNS